MELCTGTLWIHYLYLVAWNVACFTEKVRSYSVFFFLLSHVAGGILVPHCWMESVPPPGYVHSPNNWTIREFASKITFVSVQFSPSVVSDSLQPHESQNVRPPCTSSTTKVYSNSCPSSGWCHLAIWSSRCPSPHAPNPSQQQSLFQWVSSLNEVAKVLEFQFQHQSFQCIPRTDLL